VQHGLGLGILGEYMPRLTDNGAATFNTLSGKLLRPYGTMPHPNVLGVIYPSVSAFYYMFHVKHINFGEIR